MRREARTTHRQKCARDAAGRAAGGAGGRRKASCYQDGMIEKLSDEALLDATRALLRRACDVEADLLLHLGEIDERKLYLARAHPSMFAFCVEDVGFSEDAAYNRIFVARAARRLPALIEALRSGKVHLGGLRLLAPLLTVENHLELLARAAGKSKRQIEEIVARMAPKPPVAPAIRKLPEQAALPVSSAARVEQHRWSSRSARRPTRSNSPRAGRCATSSSAPRICSGTRLTRTWPGSSSAVSTS